MCGEVIKFFLQLAYFGALAVLLTIFLSGFIVVKLKSDQQNSILIKLNKIINIFVFESLSNDVYLFRGSMRTTRRHF